MSRPVAFVTGASRGIGREAALELARRGHDLVIASRTVHEGDGLVAPGSRARGGEVVRVPGSMESAAADLRALGAEVATIQLDLLDVDSVAAAGPAALAAFGRVDVFVNSAVVQGAGNMDRLVDLDFADAERIVNGNYLALLRMAQALVPPMAERGSGVFIQVSSFAAVNDPRKPAGEGGWGVAYGAAKSAAHRIAGHLHAEFGRRGVRTYNVNPGFVVTEAVKARGSDATVPSQVNGPEMPGRVIAWLASDDPAAVALAGRSLDAADHATAATEG